MSKIEFQIIYTKPILIKELIVNKLQEIVAASVLEYNYSISDIESWYSLKYFYTYPNNLKRISGFTIDFNEIQNSDKLANIISDLRKVLRESPGIIELIRLQDFFMLNNAIEYHKSIYDIEMQLREVLTYIFTFNLEKSVLERLKIFEDIKTLESRKSPKDYIERFDEYSENELFHISFNDYGKFNNVKKIDAETLADIIKRSSSFEELKVNTENRGITDIINPKHKAFIQDISKVLSPIESVRNSVMHNREISRKIFDSNQYPEKSAKLLELITDFWEQERLFQLNNNNWLEEGELRIRSILEHARWNVGNVVVNEGAEDEDEFYDLIGLQIFIESVFEQLIPTDSDYSTTHSPENVKEIISGKALAILKSYNQLLLSSSIIESALE